MEQLQLLVGGQGQLLRAVWTSQETPAIAARGYRVYPSNDQYLLLWADNHAGSDIEYIGVYPDLNGAVTGMLEDTIREVAREQLDSCESISSVRCIDPQDEDDE